MTGLVIVIGIAFGLTTAFNRLKVPTSTIQLLVSTVAGAGLAAGIGVRWSTIGTLAAIWIAAPPIAAALGYLLTRATVLVPAVRVETHATHQTPDLGRQRTSRHRFRCRVGGPAGVEADGSSGAVATPYTASGGLAAALIAVGALASFAMGSNDVANATGSLVGTHTVSPLLAGLIGGLGLAAGVLTWRRPLLHRVAFDIVTVNRPMATAAQLVQATVVLAAVALGYFTSINQALVGAMTGAAAAHGRHTVHTATLLAILRGWLIGPGAGIALAYAITRLIVVAAGAQSVLAGS